MGSGPRSWQIKDCKIGIYCFSAAQKSKLHNLQYDEGGNHMAETETYTKQQSTGRHVAPLTHYSDFESTSLCSYSLMLHV
jgi:hypothetical protein